MTNIYKLNSCVIGSELDLEESQLKTLEKSLVNTEETHEGVLSGRGAVKKINIRGIGGVVVRQFTRGGLLRRFNKGTYLGISGKTRARAEYELLLRLNSLGINAPRPVAYAFRGRILYNAWLASMEIKGAESLAEISLKDPGSIPRLIPGAALQTAELIKNRILHLDMHPGNVLAAEDGSIYLIDFDKAGPVNRSEQSLFARYCRRWSRAVSKHGLPRELDRPFRKELESILFKPGPGI